MSYNQGGYGYQQNPGGYGHPPNQGGEAQSYYSQGGQGQYQSGPPPYYNQNPAGYGAPPPPQHQQYPHQGGDGSGDRPPGSDFNPDGADGERGIAGALVGGAAGGFGGHKLGGKAGHGVLGTVAGVALGAFAGHKMQEKVGDWKDERHERREEEKRREEEQKHHHNGPPPPHERTRGGEDFAGMFSGSSRDMRLDCQNGDWVLRASCRRGDGSWNDSSISLSRYVANEGGYLRWHSGGGGGGGGPTGPTTVTVNQGDTLRGIAARFPGHSFDEIARHNNITNPDMIYPGQVLAIPGASGGGGGNDGRGNFGASARDIRLGDGGKVLECEVERGGQWTRTWIALDERISNRNGELTYV